MSIYLKHRPVNVAEPILTSSQQNDKTKCVCLQYVCHVCVAGEMVTKQPLIRSMRTVKRETLKLISGWVSRSNDPQMVRGVEAHHLKFIYPEEQKALFGVFSPVSSGHTTLCGNQ